MTAKLDIFNYLGGILIVHMIPEQMQLKNFVII
jgi:hypothetical protein